MANKAIREFCMACPVRKLCRQYQKETGSVGVWGGEYFGRDS